MLSSSRGWTAAENDVEILHAEPVSIFIASDGKSASPAAGVTATNSQATARTLEFDAFGRRFSATVIANTELNATAQALGSRATAWIGSLAGREGSWVRLTQRGAQFDGLIWDGSELIVVASSSNAKDQRTGAKPDSATVFRLADTRLSNDADACGLQGPEASRSGAAFYSNLGNELKTHRADKSIAELQRRLRLSVLLDNDFVAHFATRDEAADAVITRINNVDGIFDSQLGLQVKIASTATVADDGASRSLSSTRVPADLLRSVSTIRTSSTAMIGTGVTHLLTGRDLDSKTVGISYVGAVCSQSYGAALSEAGRRDGWYESLIMAHELGHTLGAVHDGESDCVTTGGTFLMSAVIGTSDRFSQCSLDQIRKTMPQASCLPTVQAPELALTGYLGDYRAASDAPFNVDVSMSNLGDDDVDNATMRVALPGAFRVRDVLIGSAKSVSSSMSGDACSIGAGVVECKVSRISARSSVAVTLVLSATQPGVYEFDASVKSSSPNDDASNNYGKGTIAIDTPTTPATGTATQTSAPVSESIGGGSMDKVFAALLVAMLSLRRRFARR